MVLNLLRWGDEMRPSDNLDLPPPGTKEAGIRDTEMKMAEQLVDDMSAKWRPEDYKDEFKDAIMKLVEQRVKAGQTETVTPLEQVDEGGPASAQIIDLTELLKRSLKRPPGNASKSTTSAEGAAGNEEVEDSHAPARKAASRRLAKNASKSATAGAGPATARKTAVAKSQAAAQKTAPKRRAA